MTTNSPSSSSEQRSNSFGLLDPRIQRWIWSHGWTELRDAQEQAVPCILGGQSDIIIAASTASGKTEAAFLPILTKLGKGSDVRGLAMYVSPLKALINDQWQRLEDLAGALEIPVTPWHGDISSSLKQRFFRNPAGCLLITPESIEALLVRHGSSVAGVLADLQYVVIDEMHSFMGSERGKQLQSQLARIEILLQRRVCRIGLSATLGDMHGAKVFLRGDAPEGVTLIEAKEGGQELHVLVNGILERASVESDKQAKPPGDEDSPEFLAKAAVAAELFRVLRGSNNLVFPNSRRAVEFFADRLRRLSDDGRVPNEFWPHHGSLAKEIREETEAALKQRERPATAICTNTLELGIDIGSVKSIAQIGPPPSVASLRQRLGRSGRRKGEPAILRGYAIERQLTPNSELSDLLREGLVQTCAMVRLLARGWYEPAPAAGLHASTLVQQLLSVIGQYGGCTAAQLWTGLHDRGAFSAVSREQFAELLRHLAKEELLFQDGTGLILLAPIGERIVEHYTFYAAFSTEEEFRIVTEGRTLGSLSVSSLLVPGGFVIFAGRRWEVLSVSQEDLIIEVRPGGGGTLPSFEGLARASVHEKVRTEMRGILASNDPLSFLDPAATKLLQEARENYRRLGLDRSLIRTVGPETQVILWSGDHVQETLAVLLLQQSMPALNEGICLTVRAKRSAVEDALRAIANASPPEPLDVALKVKNKVRQKWDHLLPENLLADSFASEYLDIPGAIEAAKSVITSTSQ